MLKELEKIAIYIQAASSLLVGGMTLLIFISALVRYFLPHNLPDNYDLSRHLLGVSIIWGFAAACRSGEHIKVDIFYSLVSNKVKKAVNIIAELFILLFIALLAYKTFGGFIGAYDSSLVTVDLNLPLWPAYLIFWLGTVAALIMSLSHLFLLFLTPADEAAAKEVIA